MDVKYFTDEQIKKALATGFKGEATWVPASEQRRSACAPSAYLGSMPAHPAAPRLLCSPPHGCGGCWTPPAPGLGSPSPGGPRAASACGSAVTRWLQRSQDPLVLSWIVL